MKKIFTSYFYQVRFFTPNMIPISTSVFDPIWFHEGKGSGYQYVDKRGIYCGLRCPMLAPEEELRGMCRGNCGESADPRSCTFLTSYKKQLNKINFTDFLERTEKLCQQVANFLSVKENPIPVFLVHEATTNPCSERGPLLEWLNEHGIEAEEWQYLGQRSTKSKRQKVYNF